MAGFDIAGAEKAGYSQSEIADFLASQSKFDADSARKAGYSDSDIIGHLSGTDRNSMAPATSQPTAPTRQDRIDAVTKNGWGTGVGPFADRAGAAVTDFANKYLPSQVAAGMGAATNTALNSLPMLTGGNIVGAATGGAIAPPMQGLARWFMQSAIKPLAGDLEKGRVGPAVQTMLEQGYSPTSGGVSAMRSKVGGYGDEIKGILSGSNAKIDQGAVLSRLNDPLRRFSMQADNVGDVAAINRTGDNFLNNSMFRGLDTSVAEGGGIPVQLAQEIKQGTYRSLGSKPYGEVKGAEIEAQKAIARGLKEEIASAVPEVAGPLSKQAELLNAIKVSQRRALMEANKDPINLGAAIGALHDPMSAIGLWANSNAFVKSMLARGLYSASQGVPQALGAGAGVLANYPRGALYQK